MRRECVEEKKKKKPARFQQTPAGGAARGQMAYSEITSGKLFFSFFFSISFLDKGIKMKHLDLHARVLVGRSVGFWALDQSDVLPG